MATAAEQAFGNTASTSGGTNAEAVFGVDQQKDDDLDNIIEVARNGIINGFEGIPDLLSASGQALIGGATKGFLHATGDSKTAESIPLVDVKHIPSHIVKTALNEMGVKTRSAEPGDLAENVVDVLLAAVPYIAGSGALTAVKGAALKYMGIESAAAVSGGVARNTAQLMAPDSPNIATGAEIVASGGTSILGTVGRKSVDLVKDASSALTDEGVKNRAAKVLQAQADDSAKAAEKLSINDTKLKIEPGQESGDQGLIALTRVEEAADETAALNRQSNISAQAQDEIKASLGGGGGKEANLLAQVQQRTAAFEKRMQARFNVVRSEMQDVAERIGSGSNERLNEASKRARSLLDNAYTKEAGIETSLWDKVDLKQKIPNLASVKPLALAVKDIKNKFGVFADGIPNNQVSNIKKVIKKARSGKLTLNDLKQMRTAIGSQIATEQAGQTPNKIALSSLRDIDSALLDVMEKSSVGDDLTNAIAQSRAKNKMFNSGEVGRIRGFDATRTGKVREELTLNKLLQAEEKGIVGVSDLLFAADSPEMRDTIGDYMMGLFAKKIDIEKGINPESARKFMNRYSSVLDKTPIVKEEIQNAIATGIASDKILQKGADALKTMTGTGSRRRALSIVMSHEDPAEAVSKILSSTTPIKGLKSLALTAAKDSSGGATKGLKDIVVGNIIESLTTSKSINNVDLVSRGNVAGLINKKTISAIESSGLYNKQQVANLKRVVGDLQKNAATSTSPVLKNTDRFQKIASSVLSMLALKTVIPSVTKGTKGGSLALATRASAAVDDFGKRIGTEKVNQLITRAITEDKELLIELLKKPTTVNEAKKSVDKINNTLKEMIKSNTKEAINQLKPSASFLQSSATRNIEQREQERQ